MNSTLTARPASDKQVALIARLIGEKSIPATTVIDLDTLTTRSASALIDYLFTLPRKAAADDVPAEEQGGPGYYVRDGVLFVVVENKAGTNVYAKRLVTDGAQARWDYAPGVARGFRASEVLTAEQASAFGHLHGYCFRCLKNLTDLRSAAAGYGETCSKRLGLPYPTKREAVAIIQGWDADRRSRLAAVLAERGVAVPGI